MQFDKNQKVQDFICDYLQLCKKYNLCIGTSMEDYDNILTLYPLSDYDYYDFHTDENGDSIPIYYTIFYNAINKNYNKEYFKEM